MPLRFKTFLTGSFFYFYSKINFVGIVIFWKGPQLLLSVIELVLFLYFRIRIHKNLRQIQGYGFEKFTGKLLSSNVFF
jgi:hypothetical protein